MSTISRQMESSTPADVLQSVASNTEETADAAVDLLVHGRSGLRATAEVGVQCDALDSISTQDSISQLQKEKAELQRRLDFVEELIGPTESQRKTLQEQIVAARSAALRAKYRGAGLPTKVAGRLDERLLWSCGLSERDGGLLQGGCLPNKEGILQDVSVLGDPAFRPYDEHTGETRWHSRGGMLQLSLGEVRNRFGDDVANDVVRCAKELDKWDSSRRVGVELPWHPLEDRELNPAEVIDLMDRELSLQTSIMYPDDRDGLQSGLPPLTSQLEAQENYASPYAVVNAQPRRGRARRVRGSRPHATSARGAGNSGSHPRDASSRGSGLPASGGRSGSAGSATAQGGSSAVVTLPAVGGTRRGPQDGRCAPPSHHLRHRMQESLDHSLLGCHDRIRIF